MVGVSFHPGPNLNERVAANYGQPAARRAADLLAERLRANAPDVRVWVTMADERVRTTHRHADGQAIPSNLRFVLEKPDAQHWDTPDGTHELARHPRDPDLSFPNRHQCRCVDADLKGVIAAGVSAGDTIVAGSTARVTVSVEFPRIVESEHPGQGDDGGGWAARSLDEVAAMGPGRAH